MADPEPRQETFQTFVGGMNEGIDARLLLEGQYAFGLNVSSRGGLLKTRPAFTDFGATIATGKFQGAALYRLNDEDRLVYVVAGTVYAIKLSDGSITTYTGSLSATVDRCYFCQADRYMIVQDGDASTSWSNANFPVIVYEDTVIDQSSLDDNVRVPKGGPMAYGHGRLYVATNYIWTGSAWTDNLGRVGFVSSDIYNPSNPELVLRFANDVLPLGGARHQLPVEIGYITAMTFQQNVMSGVGQGPLIVFAKNGAVAYAIQTDDSVWDSIDIGMVIYSGVGMESHDSVVHSNSDLIYRARDGIRTLAQTVQQRQGIGLANKSMSTEVEDILSNDTDSTLPLVSGARVDNRVFMTAYPSGSIFKGIISLDVNPISSVTQEGTPIYDGIWTGLDFQTILRAKRNGKETLFAFTQSESSLNELYFLDVSSYSDEGDSPSTCRVMAPYRSFGIPRIGKNIQYIELWLSDVKGSVDITAYYRFDGYPLWSKMSSGTINSDSTYPMRYTRLRLVPGNIAEDPNNKMLNRGFSLQICIEWKGYMKLDMINVIANVKKIDEKNILSTIDSTLDTVAVDTDQVAIDNYEYRIS